MNFTALFGKPPDASGRASGRVNLIGEHTDYNGGFVMPVALRRHTVIEVAAMPGTTVSAWSAQFSAGEEPATYRLGHERVRHDWLDYVQGITHVLQRSGLRVPGFAARIESDVPPGSGLSSSAALEMALLRSLAGIMALPADPAALARFGQRAENEFVGAPVGIMDQLAALLSSPDAALFIDTRALRWEAVPIPARAALIVIDSGIRHQHAGGEYAARRSECEQAAALLGVAQLRDIGIQELGRVAALPQPLDRRARHVVTENARVLEMVAALRAGDLEHCGRLLDASHESLAKDFEVSLREIDAIVSLARSHPGVLGARLTGGGFGGCVAALARKSAERDVTEFLMRSRDSLPGPPLQVVQ